jgi:hypothetical protein
MIKFMKRTTTGLLPIRLKKTAEYTFDISYKPQINLLDIIKKQNATAKDRPDEAIY